MPNMRRDVVPEQLADNPDRQPVCAERASEGGSVPQGAMAAERAARLSMRLLEAEPNDSLTRARAVAAVDLLCSRSG